eukprot:1578721-Prymnesium_polylepis.1
MAPRARPPRKPRRAPCERRAVVRAHRDTVGGAAAAAARADAARAPADQERGGDLVQLRLIPPVRVAPGEGGLVRLGDV